MPVPVLPKTFSSPPVRPPSHHDATVNRRVVHMQLLGRLHLTALVVSFALGLLFTYVVTPPPRVIVKFPSPYNAGKVLYRDRSDTCYMFKSETVDCESDSRGSVLPQPLLFEDFITKSCASPFPFVQLAT